ncbi:hypothetical protein HY745_01770, partial [Candidatus Desantisbacteria bacterium]|nr:hypothetical protein [Candidatus Desantisbacteria bacterium]
MKIHNKFFPVLILNIFLLFFVQSFSYGETSEISEYIRNDIKNIFTKHGFINDFSTKFNNLSVPIKKSGLSLGSNTPNQTKKCATSLIRDLKLYVSSQKSGIKQLLEKNLYLMRPGDPEDPYDPAAAFKEYKTTHFSIHYINTPGHPYSVSLLDLNNNTIPDIIESYSDIFEQTYNTEIALGFRPPVDDNDGYYDVYFVDLQSGIMGDAFAYTATDPEDNYPIQCPSYIVMDNDYLDGSYLGTTSSNVMGLLKVIFAHEFFHSLQFAYNAYGDAWFMEACSTWMEDVVYNDVNDFYRFLPDFLNNPQFSLEHIGTISSDYTYEYGACLFPRFLTNKYGIDLVKGTWEYMSNDKEKIIDKGLALLGLRTLFIQKGLSFDSVLGDFYTASYFISTNYSDFYANNFYKDEESRNFPQSMKILNEITYPFSKLISSDSNAPQDTGANYVIINPDNFQFDLQLMFIGDSRANWDGKIIKIKTDNSLEIENFVFTENN